MCELAAASVLLRVYIMKGTDDWYLVTHRILVQVYLNKIVDFFFGFAEAHTLQPFRCSHMHVLQNVATTRK